MRVFAWLYLALLAAIVTAANLGQKSLLRWVDYVPLRDKAMHFLLLGGACLVVNAMLSGRKLTVGRFSLYLGTAVVFLLATCEECTQIWMPYRTFSWADMTANWLGIICFDRIFAWSQTRKAAATESQGLG